MKLMKSAARLVVIIGIISSITDRDAYAQVMSGKTVVFYELNHGVQVEYYSTAGNSYLRYPGNSQIVTGRWRWTIDQSRDSATICFMYGSNTRNPVTNKRGGAWQCSAFAHYWRGVKLLCRGDPFSLANPTGRVPYVLARSSEALKKLTPLCDSSAR